MKTGFYLGVVLGEKIPPNFFIGCVNLFLAHSGQLKK